MLPRILRVLAEGDQLNPARLGPCASQAKPASLKKLAKIDARKLDLISRGCGNLETTLADDFAGV